MRITVHCYWLDDLCEGDNGSGDFQSSYLYESILSPSLDGGYSRVEKISFKLPEFQQNTLTESNVMLDVNEGTTLTSMLEI